MSKSASRPLLPVEETIHSRMAMNSELRWVAFYSNLTPHAEVPRLRWSTRHSAGKFYFTAHPPDRWDPNRTTWMSASTHDLIGPYTFNVDWYMTEHNTVANVKKFVGEFY